MGKEILPPTYNSILGYFTNGVETVRSYYKTETIGKHKWSTGLMDTDGNFIIPLKKFNDIEATTNDYQNNFYITKLSSKENTYGKDKEGLFRISDRKQLITTEYYKIKMAQNGNYAFCWKNPYPTDEVRVFDIEKETFYSSFSANDINSWGDSEWFQYTVKKE